MDDLERKALREIADAAASLEDLVFFREQGMPHLDECPFCGGTARVRLEERPDPPARYFVWLVRCMDCGAQTRDYPTGNYYGMNATPEEVAAAWNRRADTSC